MTAGGQRLRSILSQQWKHNRAAFVTWVVLRLLVVLILIRSAMNGLWENVFICLLVLFLFLLPSILAKRFGIAFPSGLQIVILLHIFACEILGELGCYYVRYPHWDTITHTVWGFLCAAIGYAMVDLLNRNERTHFQLSPAFLAVVAFCFSMTIGVLWEFFEYGVDRIFLADMQKDTVISQFASVMLDPTNSNIPIVLKDISDVSVNGNSLGLGGYLDIGLYDTMEDLFVNMIGALVFSVIGYFRSRSRRAEQIVEELVPRPVQIIADPERQTSEV